MSNIFQQLTLDFSLKLFPLNISKQTIKNHFIPFMPIEENYWKIFIEIFLSTEQIKFNKDSQKKRFIVIFSTLM